MFSVSSNQHPSSLTARFARSVGPQPPHRRGISLLEVLISMFVLMIGLMGVASLFPVGGFYAARSERFDRGTVMAEQAIDELKTRGMLRPEVWAIAGSGAPFMEDTASLPWLPHLVHPGIEPEAGLFNLDNNNFPVTAVGRAFVLDPMGAAAALEAGLTDAYVFPYWNVSAAAVNVGMPRPWRSGRLAYPEQVWPIRRVTINDALGAMTTATAEKLFRLTDELAASQPEKDDFPAMQLWEVDNAGNPLARSWRGNYSWLATIVPTSTDGIIGMQPALPGYGSFFYEVSVAVVERRVATIDPALGAENPERVMEAALNLGNELVLFHGDPKMVDAAVEDVRPGDWIALAGVNQTSGDFLLKWYRILSLDDETDDTVSPAIRRAMLDGPDWPGLGPNFNSIPDLRAIILPRVVTVATQALQLEGPSAWSPVLSGGAGR